MSQRSRLVLTLGTLLIATGTLLRFSPDGGRGPTPITDADPGEIVVKDLRLALERRDDVWTVAAPTRREH